MRYGVITLLLTIISAWMLSGIFLKKDVIVNTQSNNINNTLPTVQVEIIPETEEHFHINGLGVIKRDSEFYISSELSGKLKKRYVKEGQKVQKGDKLLELETNSLYPELNHAKTELSARQSEFDSVLKLRNSGGSSYVQFTNAKSTLENAKTRLEKIKIQIKNSMILAPNNGTIEKITMKEEEFVKAGMPVIYFSDNENNQRYVSMFISQDKLPLVQNTVDVRIHGEDIYNIPCSIQKISNTLDKETQKYELILNIENIQDKEYLFFSGKIVDVTLLLKQQVAHKIPLSAITINEEGMIGIKYIGDNEKVEFYILTDNNFYEEQNHAILHGLSGEILLIIKGQNWVKTGKKVNYKIS